MAGFIEDDTQSDSSGRHGSDGSEDEDDRTARRNKKKQDKKKQKAKPRTARRSGFSAGMVDGISAETWNDVTDVFGNGQDYSFALEEQEDMHEDKELKDVCSSWSPSALRALIDLSSHCLDFRTIRDCFPNAHRRR